MFQTNSWFATIGQQVIAVPLCEDITSLTPCNHEEAGMSMMLHAAAAAMTCGHHRTRILTVGPDVVVLAVWVAQELHEVVDELWLALGKGKNFRYIAAQEHERVACLGPEKSKSLPVFHAFTGCNKVSASTGHGKKMAWAVWNAFPEITIHSCVWHLHLHQECFLSAIERFVVLLYDCTSTCSDINLARERKIPRKEYLNTGSP